MCARVRGRMRAGGRTRLGRGTFGGRRARSGGRDRMASRSLPLWAVSMGLSQATAGRTMEVDDDLLDTAATEPMGLHSAWQRDAFGRKAIVLCILQVDGAGGPVH